MGVVAPRPRTSWLRRQLLFRVLRLPNLRALCTLDETLPAYVRREASGLATKMTLVPDPAELCGPMNRLAARADLELDESIVMLLVYGSITPRKGIDALIKAANHKDWPRQVILVFAGRQDETARQVLGSPDRERVKSARSWNRLQKAADVDQASQSQMKGRCGSTSGPD